MEAIYFQPKGIKPNYCEVGMIHESDKEYIWYLYEPYKILISEVKIIPKEDVFFNKKSGLYEVKQQNKQKMTPKQKAEKLVLKFLRIETNTEMWINTHIAKQCSLIAIDEIIYTNADESKYGKAFTQYWQEVKKEIEQL